MSSVLKPVGLYIPPEMRIRVQLAENVTEFSVDVESGSGTPLISRKFARASAPGKAYVYDVALKDLGLPKLEQPDTLFVTLTATAGGTIFSDPEVIEVPLGEEDISQLQLQQRKEIEMNQTETGVAGTNSIKDALTAAETKNPGPEKKEAPGKKTRREPDQGRSPITMIRGEDGTLQEFDPRHWSNRVSEQFLRTQGLLKQVQNIISGQKTVADETDKKLANLADSVDTLTQTVDKLSTGTKFVTVEELNKRLAGTKSSPDLVTKEGLASTLTAYNQTIVDMVNEQIRSGVPNLKQDIKKEIKSEVSGEIAEGFRNLTAVAERNLAGQSEKIGKLEKRFDTLEQRLDEKAHAPEPRHKKEHRAESHWFSPAGILKMAGAAVIIALAFALLSGKIKLPQSNSGSVPPLSAGDRRAIVDMADELNQARMQLQIRDEQFNQLHHANLTLSTNQGKVEMTMGNVGEGSTIVMAAGGSQVGVTNNYKRTSRPVFRPMVFRPPTPKACPPKAHVPPQPQVTTNCVQEVITVPDPSGSSFHYSSVGVAPIIRYQNHPPMVNDVGGSIDYRGFRHPRW